MNAERAKSNAITTLKQQSETLMIFPELSKIRKRRTSFSRIENSSGQIFSSKTDRTRLNFTLSPRKYKDSQFNLKRVSKKVIMEALGCVNKKPKELSDLVASNSTTTPEYSCVKGIVQA